MTTPTQAQIEAAAKAILDCFSKGTATPLDQRELASAALTAAAQVVECKTCGGKGLVIQDAEWEPVAVRCPDCAAARVVDTPPIAQVLHQTDAQDLADAKAAVQVGEQYRQEANATIDTGIRIATIERCAQVAEKFENGPLRFEIAAAIRKLKDEAHTAA